MNDFWLEYEKASQEESGGGGIVCRAAIETGYKVYVSGPEQADTFFPALAGDKVARKAAKSTADKLAAEYGASRGGQWGIQLRAFAADAYSRGQKATWSGDRFFNTDGWTTACKEVVVPALRELGLGLPWEGYVRIGFKPDPYKVKMGDAGMTDADQNGNPRYPQVAYVSEVFASEGEALSAVGVAASGSTPTAATTPKILTADQIEAIQMIAADLLQEGKSVTITAINVAKEMELTVGVVKPVVAEYAEAFVPS